MDNKVFVEFARIYDFRCWTGETNLNWILLGPITASLLVCILFVSSHILLHVGGKQRWKQIYSFLLLPALINQQFIFFVYAKGNNFHDWQWNVSLSNVLSLHCVYLQSTPTHSEHHHFNRHQLFCETIPITKFIFCFENV